MKNIIVGLILIIIIILSLGFVTLKSLAQGSEDNFFNQEFRSQASKSALVRKILGLHYDGDASHDYLGDTKTKIIIEIDLMEGIDVPVVALDQLKQKIQEVTKKETIYLISDRNIPYKAALTDDDVNLLEESYRDFNASDDTAFLYALIVTRFNDETTIGSTHKEFGLVLYQDALGDVISPSDGAFGLYQSSTLLHEFGHQLGLNHNQISGCLMNEAVEIGYRVLDSQVVNDFCEIEKKLIRESLQ
ncbi:MAG: hypothetical protein Q8P83_03135 [bacterium]|nr:hypothetical protein [bacterium]